MTLHAAQIIEALQLLVSDLQARARDAITAPSQNDPQVARANLERAEHYQHNSATLLAAVTVLQILDAESSHRPTVQQTDTAPVIPAADEPVDEWGEPKGAR